MSFLNDAISYFSIGPSRSFAGISGYVTLTENTIDALEITQQPVQQGAMIADHAFKKPITLSIQMKFSNNLTQNLKQTYQQLLTLQVPNTTTGVLSPFNVVTPKRTYYNMLLQTLGCTTDKTTENALSITASFQEVIIVSVGITNVPVSQLKNTSNQGVQSVGQKQSALFTLFSGTGK